MSPAVFWVLFCVFACPLAIDRASAAVRLPLEGYCRAGRFFPVALDGDDARRNILLSADGCLSCQIDAGANWRMVPILVTGSVNELRWPGGSLALRERRDDERLVGSTSANLPADLFPDARLIPIRLDSADPLPGPAVAWETLDAVLLDSPLFQRLGDETRSTLLSGGVVLAARGDRPDPRWPWRRQGSLWILAAKPVGPHDELVDDSVYAPTYAWMPGWPPRVRGQVVGIAALLLLVTFGLLQLGRNRATAGLAISILLLSAVAIIWWKASLGSVDRGGGDIVIAGNGLSQRDGWVYQRAKTTSTQIVRWTGWTHPLFASVNEMNRSEMRVSVSPGDQLEFIYQAIAGHTMAFVRREIQPGGMPATVATDGSPMEQAARAAYTARGMKVIGETTAPGGRWAGVVIGK